MAYKKEKTITVTSNLIPTCKDCVYFEKAWDEKVIVLVMFIAE